MSEDENHRVQSKSERMKAFLRKNYGRRGYDGEVQMKKATFPCGEVAFYIDL